MSDFSLSSQSAALQVIQQAVVVLAKWAEADSWLADNSFGDSNSKSTTEIVAKAQEILGWAEHQQLNCLQLVFDRVQLSHSHQQKPHFRPAWALNADAGAMKTPKISYARGDRPTNDDLEKLKEDIRTEVTHPNFQNLFNFQNLSQLTMFVEKFGSHLSFGESDTGESDIALIDLARSTAAIAAALAQQPPDDQVVLIAGDLMGVQKFIYTISSDGALKSLRARSFYLEIATEEIVYRLLQLLNLPRTNIIYAGASKFYILAPALSETDQLTIKALQEKFNDWLLGEFQKKVFLAIAIGKPFPVRDLVVTATSESDTLLSQHWRSLNDQLSAQATRKFDHTLAKILEPQPSHEPCKVCHRDDDTDRAPVNPLDPTSPDACPVCRQMFALGGKTVESRILASHYSVSGRFGYSR
ncbi:MAG: type III-A CRISPR-associated protein Cas10/Csm1, partial [Leptolyngbyaceae cyanobacterium SM1_4_3]|nr:type III-A CRISPR-associated protein Cas10/Csm1 [Leptolyngbyaceae cyanobacterium SM1_4_3]